MGSLGRGCNLDYCATVMVQRASLASAIILSVAQGRMGKKGETFWVKLLEFQHVTLCHLGEFLPHVRQKGKDFDRLKSLTCPVG